MSILNLEGAYENELATSGEFNPQAPNTALTLPSGQRVVLPTELLLQAAGEKIRSAGNDTQEIPLAADNPEPPGTAEAGTEAVIPLIAEQLLVSRQEVETARVRLRRVSEEHVETVSVPLTDIHWEIEHVAVEQRVDAQPEIRQVGETIIFPMVEERMVVKRELWLREEVHVRKVKTVVEKSAEFSVKRDKLEEERRELGPTEG